MNPLLLVDYYKTEHHRMYPDGMTLLYSNLTPRRSRMDGVDHIVFFGLQAFIKEFLIDRFKKYFFDRPIDEVVTEYNEAIDVDTTHIKALHRLGYLPIEINALPEGTRCPIGIPCLTIHNTHPDFGWLTNYLETLISCELWQPITSATIADQYKSLLSKYAIETTGCVDFVQWQGHDFSMRGMGSSASAIGSGMGHLLSFTGTDTVPAIYALKKYYGASGGLIGASVPATEHSVMCAGGREGEINTFERLLDKYPAGILSVVSDTWNLWDVCTKFLPALRDRIMARDGKLVIRPDSGDPANILCGDQSKSPDNPAGIGVVELLWGVFGGTINEKGYRVLHPCIGAIYGDSITLARAKDICERLKAKGFASTNVVLGIGSYTYQYNTRDTFGIAMKATYCEVNGKAREIFKAPITDDGTKRSAKGLIQVYTTDTLQIKMRDCCSWEQVNDSVLSPVFRDGTLVRQINLTEIRSRLANEPQAVEK